MSIDDSFIPQFRTRFMLVIVLGEFLQIQILFNYVAIFSSLLHK